MDEQIKKRLEAEAVSSSAGYVTDRRVQYIVINCAAIEIPFPWWTPNEDASVQPLASVEDLLDAPRTQDR